MNSDNGSEPCWEGTCDVYDYIVRTNTFATKACGEVFKIQSGPINCNSEKFNYLLRCNILSTMERLKQIFVFSLITLKVKTNIFEKENNVSQKCFHSHYVEDLHKSIGDWEVTLSDKCETHNQLKGRETFWQDKLKTIYPPGLNEK